MKNRYKSGVFAALRMAAAAHHLLTLGTILCVAASVAATMIPPLLLARLIDSLNAGVPLTSLAVLGYFGSLALEGLLSSAQESLLVLFGQKMTHALRSEMSRKLTMLPAGTLAGQNPGEVAARFSGDVDTVEALFTSGIISMVADACRILSIMAVIAVKNTGLALVLLLVLPLFAVFTRHVQKRMLAAQLDNRRAVAAVSGQVPETLHNIRTIHMLGLESYMERRYDRRIADGYTASSTRTCGRPAGMTDSILDSNRQISTGLTAAFRWTLTTTARSCTASMAVRLCWKRHRVPASSPEKSTRSNLAC